MSTRTQDAFDPNSLEYYAPRKWHDSDHDLASIQPLVEASVTPGLQAFVERNPQCDDASLMEGLPESLRRLIEIEDKARSARVVRKRTFAVLASFAAATGIAVGIVFIDTTKFAAWRDWALSVQDAKIFIVGRLQTAYRALDQRSQKLVAPILSVEGGSGEINAPLPLGVEVTNFVPGATVKLSGLIAGTAMSTGTASGDGEWRVAVGDLPTTFVIPPRDYVGPMNVVAELSGGNGQAIIRSPVRYNWRQASADSGKAVVLPSPAATSAANSAEEPVRPRQIDPTEAAALLQRARELVSNGDLPAARLLLQRLAEAHNTSAAFELGATYGPTAIEELGGFSAAPDLALAQTWYQKARTGMSTSAAPEQNAALFEQFLEWQKEQDVLTAKRARRQKNARNHRSHRWQTPAMARRSAEVDADQSDGVPAYQQRGLTIFEGRARAYQ